MSGMTPSDEADNRYTFEIHVDTTGITADELEHQMDTLLTLPENPLDNDPRIESYNGFFLRKTQALTNEDKLEAPIPEEVQTRARRAARDLYATASDNNIEVDETGEVIRSGGTGFWVQAWTFVRVCDCEDPEFSTSTTDTTPTCLPCGGINGDAT